MLVRVFVFLSLWICIAACSDKPSNHPYQQEASDANTLYSSFSERPKTLDPARSYTAPENAFVAQIYEPPLQYHYNKEPFELIPLTAVTKPIPQFWDKNMQRLPSNVSPAEVAYTSYDIAIKPGIFFQPHPAFAKDKQNEYCHLQMSKDKISRKKSLDDFSHTDTRELVARDYIYQIKRLASPNVNSPIYSMMKKHIVGLETFNQHLRQQPSDLNKSEIAGVKEIDRYTYRVILNGQYPQFLYWLAMPFFAPMPWEADVFYSQPGMAENNISLDWYPVGTGPYMLTVNNPNQVMILDKNPSFRGESLQEQDAEQPLPLAQIDRIMFRLETESIPLWNKFLQGYYDVSAVSVNNFDSAVQISPNGKAVLTPLMQEKGISLETHIENGLYYLGFNMLDPTVGGYTNKARQLRQAISIAIDFNEFITIFRNGRGIAAQGLIPPGIFGYTDGLRGINPIVYQFKNGRISQRNIKTAQRLLAKAGYPKGINPKTGKPLILHFDTTGGLGPDEQSQFRWYRKQFAKLGIDLQIRATQFNRLQEKLRTGNAQIFFIGWLADYPDPENFLFLFNSKNGKVKHGGENQTNYASRQYDRLFNQMKSMPNSATRQKIIDQMMMILRIDSPAVFGFYPKTYELSHAWHDRPKLASIINNTAKYRRIDPQHRKLKRNQWNQPVWWPFIIFACLLLVVAAGVFYRLWQRKHQKPRMLPRDR